MPLIECQQPIGAVATGKNYHRGIRKTNGGVRVVFHDSHSLSQGIDVKGFEAIRASGNFLQQKRLSFPPDACGQEVVKLGEDKWRQQKRAWI